MPKRSLGLDIIILEYETVKIAEVVTEKKMVTLHEVYLSKN